MRRIALRISPTLVLLVANLGIYFYTALAGGSFFTTEDSILRLYGQYNRAILYQGWWWQLITAMFVHVDIAHIAGNMLFLLIFGLRAEELFVDSEYYLVFLVSGLAGNFLTLLYPLEMTSAGASGAILGLFGAVLIYLRKVVERSIIGAVVFAFMFFLITLSVNTNIYAHLGGLSAGLIVGYWFASKRKNQFTHRITY